MGLRLVTTGQLVMVVQRRSHLASSDGDPSVMACFLNGMLLFKTESCVQHVTLIWDVG
jgi:hypothetical protein